MIDGNVPKQPGEILVERNDLRPGDMIFGREFSDWSSHSEGFGGHKVLDDKTVQLWTSKAPFLISSLTGSGRYRIVRPGTTIAKTCPTGHWNGKCPTCGQRTYTGFMTVEHEFGSCMV